MDRKLEQLVLQPEDEPTFFVVQPSNQAITEQKGTATDPAILKQPPSPTITEHLLSTAITEQLPSPAKTEEPTSPVITEHPLCPAISEQLPSQPNYYHVNKRRTEATRSAMFVLLYLSCVLPCDIRLPKINYLIHFLYSSR